MAKSIELYAEVKTPLTPNFLSVPGISEGVPIAKFTDEQLREVAKKWTEELLAKAKKRREEESGR